MPKPNVLQPVPSATVPCLTFIYPSFGLTAKLPERAPAFTSSMVQTLIWTLLQRWEKLWWADLQSWQMNLSDIWRSVARARADPSESARTEASGRGVLNVMQTAPKPKLSSFKQLGHTCAMEPAVLSPGLQLG